MRDLLTPIEFRRLRWMIAELPVLGAIDALGLAFIILVFLHVTGVREVAMLGRTFAYIANSTGYPGSEKTFGIATLVLMSGIRFFAGVGAQYWMYQFCYTVQTRLSSNLLDTLLEADLDYLARKDKSFGTQFVFNECSRFASGVLFNAIQIYYELLTLLIYLGILIYTDFKLSMGFVVVAAVTFALVRISTKGPIHALGVLRFNLDGRRLSLINEAFQGMQEVGSYRLSRGFVGKYERATADSLNASVRNQVLNLIPRNLFEILLVVALIAVAFLNQGPMTQGTIATLAIFMGAAFRCLPSINRILSSRQMMSFEMPVVDQLKEVFRGARAAKRKVWLASSGGGKAGGNDRDDHLVRIPPIRFGRVGHNNDFKLDVDGLELGNKDLVLILGDSGSGKSSYLGCIAGLLTTGLQDSSMRASGSTYRVSYAPQASFILNDTFEANITLSSFFPSRVIDKNRLLEAVRVAQLLDADTGETIFLFDKVLDGSGGAISGGQRQRIALARALYFESDLLILDEITSGLDEETERAFIEAYAKSSLRRATIFVTHRMHLVSSATKVYELSNGNLVRKECVHANR